MNKKQRLYDSAKKNPGGVKFTSLEKLATYVGFHLNRTRGSHKQYKKLDNPKCLISFQPDKKNRSMAKAYQVRELVNFIEENNLHHLLED